MRLVALLCLAASPAAAWEFDARPICTLTQAAEGAAVTVTYDPRAAQPYAIRLVLSEGVWGDGRVFAMRFADGRVISTDRHALGADGATLTVSDTGFGNVLGGMEAGGTAVAATEGREVRVPLEGVAEPLRAFRACADGGVA